LNDSNNIIFVVMVNKSNKWNANAARNTNLC